MVGVLQSVKDQWFDDDDDDVSPQYGAQCKMPSRDPDDEEKRRKRENKKGDTPGNNQAQNKQFNDAVKEIEKRTGTRLTQDQVTKLHYEISKKGLGYQQIVNTGLGLFAP